MEGIENMENMDNYNPELSTGPARLWAISVSWLVCFKYRCNTVIPENRLVYIERLLQEIENILKFHPAVADAAGLIHILRFMQVTQCIVLKVARQ